MREKLFPQKLDKAFLFQGNVPLGQSHTLSLVSHLVIKARYCASRNSFNKLLKKHCVGAFIKLRRTKARI